MRGVLTRLLLPVSGAFDKIARGEIVVVGRGSANELIIEFAKGSSRRRHGAVWNQVAHDAGSHGTSLLQRLDSRSEVPFPQELVRSRGRAPFFLMNKPTCGSARLSSEARAQPPMPSPD